MIHPNAIQSEQMSTTNQKKCPKYMSLTWESRDFRLPLGPRNGSSRGSIHKVGRTIIHTFSCQLTACANLPYGHLIEPLKATNYVDKMGLTFWVTLIHPSTHIVLCDSIASHIDLQNVDLTIHRPLFLMPKLQGRLEPGLVLCSLCFCSLGTVARSPGPISFHYWESNGLGSEERKRRKMLKFT